MTETVTLKHGIKTCSVTVNNPNNENEIREVLLNKDIIQNLFLPESKINYRIKQNGLNEWSIGPLVGVFLDERKLKEILNGRNDMVLRRWAGVLERNNGLVVLFSSERIHWESGTVKGVILRSSNTTKEWAEEELPLPTVIYDRCFGNRGRGKSIALRKKCANLKLNNKIINARSKLGKTEIYTLCSEDSLLKLHVPGWDRLKENNLKDVLEKYQNAYIKPDKMSKGKGVTRMTRINNGILLEQRQGKKNVSCFCKDYTEVEAFLSKYLEKGMVIQEEVNLLRYNGRPYDFRLLLQKDEVGKWEMTGLAARIFGQGSVISSPRSGGAVAGFEKVLTDSVIRKDIMASMLKFAKAAAEVIEEKYGLFAELGFDLGIDDKGKVWLIEINGKPIKISIDRLRNHQVSTLAYERPLEYAIYLIGFGGEKDARASG